VAVETDPRLREAFARWLGVAARSVAPAAAAMPAAGSADEAAERDYSQALQETLRAVAASDRRQGLVNLFWLAHSREIAAQIERQFPGSAAEARYRLHPLLSGVLRRSEDAVRPPVGRPQQPLGDFRRGAGWNEALVSAVIEDQLTLTEPDPGSFDPLRPSSREPAIPDRRPGLRRDPPGPAFAALAAVADNERGVLDAIGRAGVAPPAAAAPASCWDRLVFAEAVREYLLHDLGGTGALLLRDRTLRREISAQRSWGDLLDAFAEVTRCLRRAEAVHLLRRALDFAGCGGDDRSTRERFLEGRLFRFGPGKAVQSGVRTVTILFADIRDFTRTSEAPISEGDLARSLYEIFDPAAILVRRFGGRVAAYLGDGFMATFTGGSRPATRRSPRCAPPLRCRRCSDA